MSSFQSICLPRRFSSRESSASISLRRLASDTLIPPNLLRHGQEEASLERARWVGTLSRRPASSSLAKPLICPSVIHVFTSDLRPEVGLDSKPPCSSNAAMRRAAAKHGDLCPSTLHRQPARRMDGQARTVSTPPDQVHP